MKSRIWKKLNYILGFLAILILFCLTILHANNEIKDLDLWLHLKSGEYIVQNKIILDKDIFSFSIAGKPWINHEWLFQAIAYLFYHKLGGEGLISMQVMVVVVTFLILLFLGFRRVDNLEIVFGLLLVLLVYRTRFTIRPDIFSLLFFSVFLYLLARHLDKRATVYILPLVQILWVNSHGFFFLGIAVIFLYLVAEFIKRQVKFPWKWNDTKLSETSYRKLKILFLLVFLASFANPYTIRGVMYPFQVLSQLAGESRIFFNYIQELKRPLTLEHIFDYDGLVYYKFLIVFSALSFYFNRRKLDLKYLFLWILFLVLSLLAYRNIVFFSFVAFAVTIINIEQIDFSKIIPLNFREEKFKQISKALVAILLIFWMMKLGNSISASGYFVFENFEMKSAFRGISQRAYPQKAIDFLLENKITGNIVNDFNSGAYLIGKCYPALKVYIDGRTELYGPKFFNNYRKMFEEDARPFEQLADKYKVNVVLLSSVFHRPAAKILRFLYKSPQWKLVYFDEYAVIFLRNTPENKALIDKYRIDLEKWAPEKVDLLKLGPRRAYPYININRANALNILEFNKPVLREAEEALKIMPECGEAYILNGLVLVRESSWGKAFENFRLAVSYLPGNAEARTNLGIAYGRLKDQAGAIKQFKAAISADPNYTNSYYQLALIYISNKDYKEAVRWLRQAAAKDPKQLLYQEALADSLVSQNKFVDACEVLRKALEVDTNKEEIRIKLAKCYTSIGLTQEAEKEYKKVLKIDPQNKEAQKQLQIIKHQE